MASYIHSPRSVLKTFLAQYIVRNGKRANGTQYYKCTECSVSFVRTKGTIFYHKRLNKKDVAEICRHLVETNSFRGVARETEHNKNTICSYVSLIAKHCKEANNFLIHDVKLGKHEINELWSFVKMSEIFHQFITGG